MDLKRSVEKQFAAVAANYAVFATGSDTAGSIRAPANVAGTVGIKPTLGLVSRSGIIPIAHSQETAGPMTRTVTDAAILLQAMAGRDEADPLADAFPGSLPDYADGLSVDALQGARIASCRRSLSPRLLLFFTLPLLFGRA